MTKYIDITKQEVEQPEPKKTVFTHIFGRQSGGWHESEYHPEFYMKVLYLGNCATDGDMFIAYSMTGCILLFKGIKGDEFNG